LVFGIKYNVIIAGEIVSNSNFEESIVNSKTK